MTRHGLMLALAALAAALAACRTPGGNARVEAVTADTPVREGSSRTIRLSVVSTNDLHGHIEALPRIGGFVANLRRARAADGGGVLLLDGGDAFQGELASNLNEGAAVVDAYNVLGYTAVAIGNHEFDFGPVGPRAAPRPGDDPRGALLARAAQAHYPLLAANLVETATGRGFAGKNIAPSTIVEVAGVKVGLVGALTLETTQSVLASVFAGLRLTPLAEAIVREARDLRAKGATLVLVVAHAGGRCAKIGDPDDLSSCDPRSEIFEVARALPPGTVDGIVAGHSHEKLAQRVNGVPIIEAGANGLALARVDFLVDARTKRPTRHEIHVPVAICAKVEGTTGCAPSSYEQAPVADDSSVAPIVHRALAAADELRNQDLGVTLLSKFGRPAGKESPLSNLVADLMRKARPLADVTLMHAGGLRADLPAGRLRYGAFYETYPRDSTFAVTTLTGAELARIIEANFTGPSGLLVSISGARAEARCENGALVVNLRHDDGRPIAPDAVVRVATNNLLATGAKGPLGGRPWIVEDDPPIREELVRVLREQGGSLAPDDKTLFDAARPRITLPSGAPIDCARPDQVK